MLMCCDANAERLPLIHDESDETKMRERELKQYEVYRQSRVICASLYKEYNESSYSHIGE